MAMMDRSGRSGIDIIDYIGWDWIRSRSKKRVKARGPKRGAKKDGVPAHRPS